MVYDVITDRFGSLMKFHDSFLKRVLFLLDFVLDLFHRRFLFLGHPERLLEH